MTFRELQALLAVMPAEKLDKPIKVDYDPGSDCCCGGCSTYSEPETGILKQCEGHFFLANE